jgi:hypothetical protein
MVEWGVHGKQPSIFLMQTIIPFRLIEHHFGGIVNSIEGRRIESGLETTPTRICNRHEMKLKQT